MGNQDQQADDNSNSTPDISLGASLGIPGGTSGHMASALSATPQSGNGAASDLTSPLHPEIKPAGSSMPESMKVVPTGMSSSALHPEIEGGAAPIQQPKIPQTQPLPASKETKSDAVSSVVPQSGIPLTFTDAVTKVAETHQSADFEIPKETTPKIEVGKAPSEKASLGSLSGKLQSGGGKNIFSAGIIRPPELPRTTEPAKNPLMDELRKQSTENSIVRPIRTYKDDISMLIEKRKTSFVGAVAAEANRRAKTVEATEKQLAPRKKASLLNYGVMIGAFFFIVIGLGVVTYAYLTREKGVGTVPASALPKLVFSEHQEILDLTGKNRRSIIDILSNNRTGANLRLGSITQYYPTVKSAVGSPRLLSGAEFLKQLDITIPGTLSRTLEEPMMLGLHGFNGNQYFIILKVTDYERGFAGMLEWEKTIENDLFLPFGIGRIQKSPPQFSTPQTASSTASTTATSSKAKSPTTTEEVSPITTDDFISRAFVDIVVKNINARAVKRDDGSIALLYGFPDKNTIVIASTESTFVEIVSRLQSIRI